MPHRALRPAALWLLVVAGAGIWQAGAVGAPTPVRAAPAAAAQRFVIDPEASEASYRVGETFFENNRFNVAVGVTRAVQGEIYVDRAHPRLSRVGPITIDLSRLTSDSRRRDDAIRRRWLESEKYPRAVFVPTAIEGLPATYVDGQEIRVRIAGALTIRDVTKPTLFTGTLKLSGDTLTGTMESRIVMTDYGFDPPAILGVLKAENQATLGFRFTARRAAR